jgi:hypothetical protein
VWSWCTKFKPAPGVLKSAHWNGTACVLHELGGNLLLDMALAAQADVLVSWPAPRMHIHAHACDAARTTAVCGAQRHASSTTTTTTTEHGCLSLSCVEWNHGHAAGGGAWLWPAQRPVHEEGQQPGGGAPIWAERLVAQCLHEGGRARQSAPPACTNRTCLSSFQAFCFQQQGKQRQHPAGWRASSGQNSCCTRLVSGRQSPAAADAVLTLLQEMVGTYDQHSLLWWGINIAQQDASKPGDERAGRGGQVSSQQGGHQHVVGARGQPGMQQGHGTHMQSVA